MRAQGIAAAELQRYLADNERLDVAPAAFSAEDARKQLDALHTLERDSLFRRYVRETVLGADAAIRYRWYDTLELTRALPDLRARCRSYRTELPFALVAFFGLVALLFSSWWWWFGARRA